MNNKENLAVEDVIKRLKKECLSLRLRIPRLKGLEKKITIQYYVLLFDSLMQYEQIEKSLYLERYE